MQPDSYKSLIKSSLCELRKARQILLTEISAYPSPIAGCDEQFNQLLSDRARISKAIRALESNPFVPTPRVLHPGSVSESR